MLPPKTLETLLDRLGRKITVLVIPHTEARPRKLQFSAAFLVFGVFLWSGVTIWAGYLAGRHVDYWITKADNKVLLAKVSYLSKEMDKSREVLDIVQTTDKQLRALLRLPGVNDIMAPSEAVGGPTSVERLDLKRHVAAAGAAVDQATWSRRFRALREQSRRRLASFQEIAWYISNQRSVRNATPNMWPTAGQLTSVFGYRLAAMQRSDGELDEVHQGIDIANAPDTLIYATADGTVRHSGWSHGYGRTVVIDHGYGMSTLFAHTSKALVKEGDRVSRGQVIAYIGTTGRSTGAHLHYEVWKHGRPVNPLLFLNVQSSADGLAGAGVVRATGR